MKAVTSEEMRRIETKAVALGTDLSEVMERAGGQVARVVNAVAMDGSVLVLVGPGNNGGDGLVAARVAAAAGRRVDIYTFARDGHVAGASVTRADEDPDRAVLRELVSRARIVVDALLGTGQSRSVTGPLATIVSVVNERPSTSRLVAVDVPTGVDASTGAVLGTAIRADVTLCVAFPKLGVLVGEGRALAGRVAVAEVGLSTALVPSTAPGVLDVAEAARLYPARPIDSNKGSFGHLLVIAGSRAYLGAPVLVASAALMAGTGLVELAATDDVRRSVAANIPEVIFRPVAEEGGQMAPSAATTMGDAISRTKAVAIGPGLGRGPSVESVVLATLAASKNKPTVVDADALNVLSQVPSWWKHLPTEPVLTPHPGEMARLTGESIEEIQRDRMGIAKRFAELWAATVLLKGSATVIAGPDGRLTINPTGSANLATAGSGDVLTGTIGGLLAQGVPAHVAAILGAYWHGTAGDLARARDGLAGTIAGDLPHLLPQARERIIRQGDRR